MNPENSGSYSDSYDSVVNTYPAGSAYNNDNSESNGRGLGMHIDSTQNAIQKDSADDPRTGWPKSKLPKWKKDLFQDVSDDTYLQWSVLHRNPDAVRQMVNNSQISYLDAQNEHGQTALHLAVLTNQPIFVGWLVAAGASLRLADAEGDTPMHLACVHENTECVKELLAASAQFDFEQCNFHGKRCVHIAAEASNIEILRCLVVAGADINSREECVGYTPLHIAVDMENEKLLDFLLSECRSLWLGAVSRYGLTAYHVAATKPNESIMYKLCRYGAKQFPPVRLEYYD